MEKVKATKKRRLNAWQKLLLVLLCTAIAGAATWLWCERIAVPRYADATARATIQADYGALFSEANGDRIYGEEGLDIIGCFQEELASDSFLTQAAADAGITASPAELKEKIRYSLNVLDGERRTVNIDASWPDEAASQRLARAAADGLDRLLNTGLEGESANTITEQGITETSRKV